MTSIKLTITGAQAWASVTGPLTSGMVGIPVTIEYDETWDGLTKNLMCRCSPWGSNKGEYRAILNVGETAAIAHEIMQADMYLYLGVEGFSDDGKLVIPTIWARCGKIEYGANTCEDPSTNPELSVWNQLQTEMEQLKECVLTSDQVAEIQAYAREAGQAAEEAKQAAASCGSSLYYTPVVTQPTDNTLKFEFKPSVTGAPVPNPVTVELPGGDSSQNVGLSAAQINALDGMFKVATYDDSKDVAGAYAAFRDAFGLTEAVIPATGIALSVSTLSFTAAESKIIAATVAPSDTTDTVTWASSAPGVATVADGLVTPVADGDCVITATAGSVSASCAVSVAFAGEVEAYTITNNLTNCSSSNGAASIVEGGSYSAALTADDGYTLEGAAVAVVVNGEDVTDTAYADGVISIPNVTGDVVITASAVEESDEGGEVVMLKNISFDGTSYLDTEVIPESVHYRYVLGIQAPSKDITSAPKNISTQEHRRHLHAGCNLIG